MCIYETRRETSTGLKRDETGEAELSRTVSASGSRRVGRGVHDGRAKEPGRKSDFLTRNTNFRSVLGSVSRTVSSRLKKQKKKEKKGKISREQTRESKRHQTLCFIVYNERSRDVRIERRKVPYQIAECIVC